MKQYPYIRASAYIDRHHRHNAGPKFHKFSVCLRVPGEPEPVGVAVAGIPKARHQMDGETLEIDRCCTDVRYADVCSSLYARAIRIGREMGYRRFLTYTLPEESGSGLNISQGITSYLEKADPAAFPPGNWAKNIKAINDILQGRSKKSAEELLTELDQTDNGCFTGELAALRRNVQGFLHQKALLSRTCNKGSSGKPYKFKTYKGFDGRSLKIVDQQLFDRAAKQGFPPNFFRETYFDGVKFYCLPERADFYGSTLQGCTFAVCRISAPSFIGASIYDSAVHSCVLEHGDFFGARLVYTHFHDSTLSYVTFQKARLKCCNTIDCSLNHVNYLIATLDGCSFGRVTPSDICNLPYAAITQGGATEEECRQNREAIFRALNIELEAA